MPAHEETPGRPMFPRPRAGAGLRWPRRGDIHARRRTAVVAALLVLCAQGFAQTEAPAAEPAAPAATAPVDNSSIDAPLFYQLLIGEMQLREGEEGAAFEVMLDAARRTRDEQVFRRATDIALEARAGDQALAAARAWRSALPASPDAQRYIVQILLALSRSNEAVEPLQSLLRMSPDAERPGAIAALPRLFGRIADRRQAGPVIAQVLGGYADKGGPAQVPALVSIGRGWQLSEEPDRALEFARRAQTLDARAEGPALLAIELMGKRPAAEELVRNHLAVRPDDTPIRALYAQALAAAQRYPDAIAQLETLTRDAPDDPAPWLTLGALHLELRHPTEADAALQRFIELLTARPAAEGEEPGAREEALTQAWLMLSQAAEQRGDLAAAETWLAKVESPQRALEVQVRRASLLARQGQLERAREMVRAAPERSPQDARAKLMAEASVLRDVKHWQEAHDVLALANERFPDDTDLLYEQSMTAEKLDRMDEMERLLRRVIALKPDHHHAYNALGYSLADRSQRLPEAKELIERALALAPGEPFITDSLGWVEYRLGNHAEAVRLLRQAYASRPDTEIGAHLGEVLWMSGQREEARRIWLEAQGRDRANDVLRETLARLQVEL